LEKEAVKMADSEYDIEVESDDSDDLDYATSFNIPKYSKAGRRAHHNALVSKRRDQMKKSLLALKNVMPSLRGQTNVSEVILKQAMHINDEYKARVRQLWQNGGISAKI